jgi:hypothetical protein
MESHAVKYPGRQVFFVRTNVPLLGPDMGRRRRSPPNSHCRSYEEGAQDGARVSNSVRSRFLVGGGAVVQDGKDRAIGKNRFACYGVSCMSNRILTSSLALTPVFPGGLMPKSVCLTEASPV